MDVDAWIEIQKQITEIIDAQGTDILFFRGHSDASWKLEPTIARCSKHNRNYKEKTAYFDFVTRSGSLLPEENSSWNVAFSMQHHGLPTRLLDWTESFATALYFALKGAKGDACVWVLNPFALNKHCINREELIRPQNLLGTYEEYFIDETRKLEGKAVSVSPLRHHPRVFNQRAGFTIHDDLDSPLEVVFPGALNKVVIPERVLNDARKFIKLIGLSEFSLFPDLDGLSREIYSEHFSS